MNALDNDGIPNQRERSVRLSVYLPRLILLSMRASLIGDDPRARFPPKLVDGRVPSSSLQVIQRYV